jgi:hypothetical protein
MPLTQSKEFPQKVGSLANRVKKAVRAEVGLVAPLAGIWAVALLVWGAESASSVGDADMNLDLSSNISDADLSGKAGRKTRLVTGSWVGWDSATLGSDGGSQSGNESNNLGGEHFDDLFIQSE